MVPQQAFSVLHVQQQELSWPHTTICDPHKNCNDCMQVTAWRAGHVLGAAMFMVEIDGMRLLYTGDYSRAADRHMSAADLPTPKPHICEILSVS